MGFNREQIGTQEITPENEIVPRVESSEAKDLRIKQEAHAYLDRKLVRSISPTTEWIDGYGPLGHQARYNEYHKAIDAGEYIKQDIPNYKADGKSYDEMAMSPLQWFKHELKKREIMHEAMAIPNEKSTLSEVERVGAYEEAKLEAAELSEIVGVMEGEILKHRRN